jgi:hypothetical protein
MINAIRQLLLFPPFLKTRIDPDKIRINFGFLEMMGKHAITDAYNMHIAQI